MANFTAEGMIMTESGDAEISGHQTVQKNHLPKTKLNEPCVEIIDDRIIRKSEMTA